MTRSPALRASWRVALCLAGLALASGCTQPPEDPYPLAQGTVYRTGGVDVLLRAKYDIVQVAYFVDVLPLLGPLEPVDRDAAVRLVEEEFGPTVCNGQPLKVERAPWGVVAPVDAVAAYESRGGWQIVAECPLDLS
ncbi:MAG: hypothetical protein ACFBRM_03080 [Pikeienuella sp.]